MKKQRILSVELWRVLLMFGIVWLHVTTQAGHLADGGRFTRHFINILSPCVEGFVFLSGYYGIRLKIGKALKLVGLAFLFSALLTLPFSGWRAAWDNAAQNWFLYAYLVLMLFAPAFNAALENKTPREMLAIGLPIVFAIYGWSYLCCVPGIKGFMPHCTGFAPLSFFTMFGIYVAARLFRLLDGQRYFTGKRILLVGGGGCAVMILAGFHHHNSPFSLVFTMCVFTVFNRLHIPAWLEKMVALIAPSMFSVFLIHGTAAGHRFFGWFQNYLIGAQVPLFVAYFIDALVVFVLCVVIDLVRRGVGKLWPYRKVEMEKGKKV